MYNGELRAHPSVATHQLQSVLQTAVTAPPLLFVDTAGRGFEEAKAEGADSFHNDGEAALVLRYAQALVAAGLAPNDLAIIAPYRAQIALLREQAQAVPDLAGMEIDTVDAFQGREKEAILISLTRSNAEGRLGFLADARRPQYGHYPRPPSSIYRRRLCHLGRGSVSSGGFRGTRHSIGVR